MAAPPACRRRSARLAPERLCGADRPERRRHHVPTVLMPQDVRPVALDDAAPQGRTIWSGALSRARAPGRPVTTDWRSDAQGIAVGQDAR